MERKIITTADGSNSIAIPELKVTYHSIHGAIQESKHVFIEAGLNYAISNVTTPSVKIFEMGLGTGLNSFLTAIESEKQKIKIQYTAIEAFPIAWDESLLLNYASELGHVDFFHTIHDSKWNELIAINEYFTLKKVNIELQAFSTSENFNLVYYDAFAPSAQPELWTKGVFEKLFFMLEPDGVLVTYCSKGDVRRAMMAAGFTVTKVPGPPGKREILRATKAKKDSS